MKTAIEIRALAEEYERNNPSEVTKLLKDTLDKMEVFAKERGAICYSLDISKIPKGKIEEFESRLHALGYKTDIKQSDWNVFHFEIKC